jgi:hypothetical protein
MYCFPFYVLGVFCLFASLLYLIFALQLSWTTKLVMEQVHSWFWWFLEWKCGSQNWGLVGVAHLVKVGENGVRTITRECWFLIRGKCNRAKIFFEYASMIFILECVSRNRWGRMHTYQYSIFFFGVYMSLTLRKK